MDFVAVASAVRIVERLEGYRNRFRSGFEIAPLLRRLADEGRRFHDLQDGEALRTSA